MRKTAAICVAKLYDINAELVVDRGFVEQLKEMLADANPMVVANAGRKAELTSLPPRSPRRPALTHCSSPPSSGA